nr:adenylate kinase [Candidatus Cloacimonadota bacterium]
MIDAIVFMGIQGSGKGTQAKLLAVKTGYQHINIGDLLRKEGTKDTDLGKQVKSTIQLGDLVPDKIIFALIQDAVSDDCSGIIFDGFPRNLSQAEYLVQNFRVMRVYYLDLEESVAIDRIKGRRVCSQCGTNYHLTNEPPKKDSVCDLCGGVLITRSDDSPKAVEKRVQAFFEETFVLKDFFEKRGVLIVLPAERSIAEIQKQILSDLHLD